MPLSWFPFDATAYTGDTAHLTCEEHGAYLQLMLAYYRSEKPLPATDRALAAIVKLPLDRWIEAKPAIAPFFREHEGVWVHDYIESVMREAKERIAATQERNSKAAQSRWSKDARGMRDASKTNTARTAAALPEQCADDAHLQLQSTLSLRARDRSEDIGDLVPVDFKPTAEEREACRPADDAEIDEQVRTFIAHHRERATVSSDWRASWSKWWSRYLAWKAKQPAPKPKPVRAEPGEITVEIWKRALLLYAKDQSKWPYQSLGPEPGMPGCRVPAAMFAELRLDRNGLPIRETVKS